MERRSERYPIIGLSLSPERVKTLRAAAAKYRYNTRRGPQPGGLAKDLFEWAWPIFERAEFDPLKLPSHSAEEDAIKDWFYGFYMALPAERRDGIIRSLSDRFNYPAPPVAHAQDRPAKGSDHAAEATPRARPRR